jgi:Flp pilus assembly pilin Flp
MLRSLQFLSHSSGRTLLRDERGLSTVEYVIILVLLAAAAVGVWTQFGGTITSKIKASDKEIQENVVIEQRSNSSGANVSATPNANANPTRSKFAD